jgi:hypothetical protein
MQPIACLKELAMKLRLFGNSLRLRLTPAEVAQLADRGLVSGETRFGAASRLCYCLRASPSATSLTASFDSINITVDIPTAAAGQWARGDEVGLSAIQQAGDGASLRIVIEKDFDCIDAEKNEPGIEFYPNPSGPKVST